MSVIEASTPVLRTRIAFFYIAVGAVIVVLAGGLAYRQLFKNDWFVDRERLQSQRRVLIPGPRGEIYDREGRVLVANRPSFTAVLYFSDARLRRELLEEQVRLVRSVRARQAPRPIEPYDVRARINVVQRYLDQCGRILHKSFAVDARAMERHFSQQPLLPYQLLKNLAPQEFAALVEQMPTGSPVQILPSTMRHYPYGSAAAHALGTVTSALDVSDAGLEGADLQTFFSKGTFGRDGLEKEFDTTLQGKTGSEIWVVDPAGFQVPPMLNYQAPMSGRPIHTSIDLDLQLAGEEAFGTNEGALVAIDINSGEVLALISRPDYDLNDTTPFIPHEVWDKIMKEEAFYSRATQGTYPPGSTFKIITSMACLRAGVIKPDTTFDCPGYVMVGNRKFDCHNRAVHGSIHLPEALRVSCNVFFMKAALELGVDRLAAEAKLFGLDHPTGIELPSETKRMVVPDPAYKRALPAGEVWTGGDTANMAIGQGFLDFTPLQMACFTASFARNETITRPTILRRDHSMMPPAVGNRSIGVPPELRALIIEGMEMAAKTGTAKRVAVPGVRLGAKTGTAQKEVWVEGRKRRLNLAWTTAFGPIERPAIAVTAVVVGDVDEETAGGAVAGPIAQKVLAKYFEKHPPPKPIAPVITDIGSAR